MNNKKSYLGRPKRGSARHDLIKRIALASSPSKCPPVVPLKRGRVVRTGQVLSPYGAHPAEPCVIEDAGYAFELGNCLHNCGQHFATEGAAQLWWRRSRLRQAVLFARELRQMDSAALLAQAKFWLGEEIWLGEKNACADFVRM